MTGGDDQFSKNIGGMRMNMSGAQIILEMLKLKFIKMVSIFLLFSLMKMVLQEVIFLIYIF